MCGIAGFVSAEPPPGAEALLARMTGLIRHRGPDGAGFHTGPTAFLGHRRLSIIDLAGGSQPMYNEDRSLAIVYNGEIFNHASLRPALENAGHRYASHCDTETILHAFEQHGPACLDLFRGMFSFAIWDSRRRLLFCARDRLGIKPFYYFFNGSAFVFASEIKAILAHPAVPTSLNPEVLPEVLAFGYTGGDGTLFAGIRKLPPGHHLTLDLSGPAPRLDIRRYWDVPAPGEPPRFPLPSSPREWIAETRRRLEETVRMRLMSDVPLGMFLSGGVDSSAIAALVQRQSSSPLNTFAVGYSEAPYSELSYASRVARSIGTEHRQVVLSSSDFFNALPRLLWHEDEPIAWPSSVPLAFVSSLAAQHVKVVLTGEGSDELFGGYERYRWTLLNRRAASLYSIVPASARAGLRSWLGSSSALGANLRRRLLHSFLGRDSSIESLYLDNFYAAFGLAQQNRLLASPPGAVYGPWLSFFDSRPTATPLARMLYADQKTYLVELLMKQDQMSMSASIESRVPFLDHTFVEFASYVPDSLKIHRGTQKYILKRAVEDLLPRDIVHRRKMGFPTPLRQWLLAPAAAPLYGILTARDSFLASCLDRSEIARLVERHRSGAEDATDRIWRLLNLELWAGLFLTGSRQPHDSLLPSGELSQPLAV